MIDRPVIVSDGQLLVMGIRSRGVEETLQFLVNRVEADDDDMRWEQ